MGTSTCLRITYTLSLASCTVCSYLSYLLAVPIGRNANEQNGLKDAHLPLESLNFDISLVRIDTCTVRAFHPEFNMNDFGYKFM